jgi:hypothetical protein
MIYSPSISKMKSNIPFNNNLNVKAKNPDKKYKLNSVLFKLNKFNI